MPLLRPTALATLTACLLLAACAQTAPAPPTPEAPPAHFKEARPDDDANSSAGAAATAPIPDAWWQLFQDPVLNALEQRLVIGNENLKLALAQLASARAVLTGSQSATQPTISASLSGTRSANATNNVNGASTDASNNVSLSAAASWEPDLWGRLSLGIQNAQASAQASEADLAAARLSAQATLAQTYFALRGAEAQQALLERNVQAYQRALELTQYRYQGGVAAQTDVLQATTQLQSVLAQNADMLAQRAQYEHAIAVLLGLAPSNFHLASTAQLPPSVTVPHDLPALLLQRRPDIAAAQLRVKAAYAQIGIADAAFFPSLTLSASAGYSQNSLANLVNAPNLVWSLGAALSQSVLDAGVHQLAVDQAHASADQLTASYRQLVLTALQEVEDNLVLASRLADEVQAQTRAMESSTRNLEIVTEQYKAGTVGYLNVSAAQSAELGAEMSLLTARTREITAINILLKNIGGRWNSSAPAQ